MDGGAMITGSHNAAEYNGFKLGVGPTTIFGAEIQKLADIIEKRDFHTSAQNGTLNEVPILSEYGDFIRANIMIRPGLKVAVDGGNGCGGVVAEPLMQELGANTYGIHIEMDGRFPNHHPDPTVEENMRDLIADGDECAPCSMYCCSRRQAVVVGSRRKIPSSAARNPMFSGSRKSFIATPNSARSP